jgi:SAM-dependent methyltransferase
MLLGRPHAVPTEISIFPSGGGEMRAYKALKKMAWRIQEQGLWKTARLYLRQASDCYHEWRLGITTSGEVGIDELGFDNPEHRCYMPSDYHDFRRVMDSLDIHEERDVFLDIGSGKGRALIMAGKYPFRRIIGVELSPSLNRIAEENIRRALKRLRCKNISVVTADASTYPIPDEVTIIYFYNPFLGETLSRVLVNIRNSLLSSPRNLTIVYRNVTQAADVLSGADWLSKRMEFPSLKGPGYDYVVYQARL